MCARCHARAARIGDDYVHGKPLQDSHRLATLDEGLYWSDGQIRDEVYEWGSFMQSRMQAKGVTCSDCHDPHTLELRRPGNDVCAQCHQPAKYDASAHTHHAKGTRAAECVACHMPTTTYMRIDDRHDHSLRIPRPDLSAKLGTPNACNACHAKKTPQWAAEAIRGWTARAPAGYQTFGEALQAATAGAPGARGALMTIADDPAQPAIARASALERLGRMLSPSSLPTVTKALNDPDPVVRLAAVEAIGATDAATSVRYLPRMLNDPVRSIRIEAARALAGPTEARLAATDRDAFAKALAEYVAVQNYNADRSEGRMSLAGLYATRGDLRTRDCRIPQGARDRSHLGRSAGESRRRLSCARRRRRKSRPCCAKASRKRRAPRRCITRWGFRTSGRSVQPTPCASSARRRSSRRTTPATLTCTRSR